MTEQQLTPEEKRVRRSEYKKNYCREYYAKKKQDPDFMEKRRQTTRRNYNYARKTIDCPHCQLRHRPDSESCVFLKAQRLAVQSQQITAVIYPSYNTLVEPPQSD